jgi:hypothetical protein
MYRDIGDIRPTVEATPPSEDTCTEGGMLRYENHDLKTQIRLAHEQLDLLALNQRVEIPRKSHSGLHFTVNARVQALRDILEKR